MKEEERIQLISSAIRGGAVVGFFVNDDTAAGRYIEGVRKLVPEAEVKFRRRWVKTSPVVLVRMQLPGAKRGNN